MRQAKSSPDHGGGGKRGSDGLPGAQVLFSFIAGQHQDQRALKRADRLPQGPPGKQSTVAEGAGCIQQDHIQIAVELKMLKAVIQEKKIRAKTLPSLQSSLKTVASGDYRNAGKFLGQKAGLIPGLGGLQENSPSIADHVDSRGPAAVAPAE